MAHQRLIIVCELLSVIINLNPRLKLCCVLSLNLKELCLEKPLKKVIEIDA